MIGSVLKIVQAGNPVLRTSARALLPEEIATPAVQELILRMRATMHDAPGVGLAAPQVGEPLRLVVIEDPPSLQAGLSEEDKQMRERKDVPFHVLINPVLTILDSEPLEFFEGCLSVRDRVMLVPRARTVRVEALDQLGQPVVHEASGWYARILQHECDHLDGVLCIDRMWSRSFMESVEYARFWSGMTVTEIREKLGGAS